MLWNFCINTTVDEKESGFRQQVKSNMSLYHNFWMKQSDFVRKMTIWFLAPVWLSSLSFAKDLPRYDHLPFKT